MNQGLDNSSCLSLADQKKQRRLANNRATASVSRSRKRDHLQTLQVRLGYLEKENARMTQKLIQQDAELDKFRQGLPSNHPADIGKAEEEAVAVQELSQCPKAVVLRPAQSALPRIFCSVANPPSSSYPQRPQTAPQDTLLNGIIQGPTRRSKRMADSYAAIDTRQDSGSHGLTDVAEPVSGSSSDQQASKSVHADEASRQTSVERSVSPTTEALPGVTLPANQPASFGIITSGDSSQLTLKCERSVNLIHLSGQRAPPHTSEYPVKRQATPSAMHPGSMTQGHDSLHLEPAALSHEHIHHHNHFHHQQQQQPDMVQTGSCHFDSLQMHAPTGLADATAQSYSGQAPDAQQPVQQAAWASAHLQTDQFSMLGILPVGMLHEGSSESGSGSSSPKQRAGWGWSVTTGHDKHAAQYGSDQDAQFSRLPMSGVLPQALSTSDASWEQQAWQDAWQQRQCQEQQHHHRQQQQTCGSDQWAMLNHCFDQWQPSSVDAVDVATKQSEPDGALAGLDESEGSWWMMPHCEAKHS
ncbi:TPA: hypothetical protein ACH3X1_006220 [Trebouxia sp. C0004]